MKPKIIFEDRDLLVLDKPSGVIVNRSDTTKGEKTVQDWVETKFKTHPERSRGTKFKIENESDFYKRAGIVHRLDKETSGILLVAKNVQAFTALQVQFKERKVQKTYIALAHGKIALDKGEIKVPVGRLPWNRKRFGVVSGGREAITKYKILNIRYLVSEKNKEPLTLLELYPETGRTHQIRVHLKYINHPVFADPLYAGRKTSRQDRKFLSRIFLHASKISFNSPRTGDLVSFESPLGEELKHFLETLNS